MTGREKFEAAFSPEGAREFAAGICYHGICLRDHWDEATDQPWWTMFDPEPVRAARPMIDMIRKTGEDWFPVSLSSPRSDRQHISIEVAPEGVFRVDRRTGERRLLKRPPPGGEQAAAQKEHEPPAAKVCTLDDLDRLMDERYGSPDATDRLDDGTLDLPRILVGEFGAEKLPMAHVASPCWQCYSLWGFQGMMTGFFDFPQLIERACSRFFQNNLRRLRRYAAAGVKAVWIEECMTDMLSPEQYRRFNLPWLRQLVEAIRAEGMFSIYYYCGRPNDRWDLLLESRADCLALEESKKTFSIDIGEVARHVRGRMALLGNVDAIHLLAHGSEEELRAEIARQVKAGRQNRSRFAVCLGSPVTPVTPLSRVRLFCDLVHELGAK